MAFTSFWWPHQHFCIRIDNNLSYNHRFRMEQHSFKTHAYLQVTFIFFKNFLLVVVVALDSAFRVCLWLFLYTPLLFRPLLLSVAPLWPFSCLVALFCLLSVRSEGVWRRTAGVWACSQKKKGQPILTPPLGPLCSHPPPPRHPRLTPRDENSWSAAQIPKFQICRFARRTTVHRFTQLHTCILGL